MRRLPRDHSDSKMADDPTHPTDPTWEELEASLREAGLDWDDLSPWGLGPMAEDLDLTPMFLAGAASERESDRE